MLTGTTAYSVLNILFNNLQEVLALWSNEATMVFLKNIYWYLLLEMTEKLKWKFLNTCFISVKFGWNTFLLYWYCKKTSIVIILFGNKNYKHLKHVWYIVGRLDSTAGKAFACISLSYIGWGREPGNWSSDNIADLYTHWVSDKLHISSG
jgi:hypothetical protein